MGYWQTRMELPYYRIVREMISDHSASTSIIDVGAWDTPMILTGNFAHRTVVDLYAPKTPLPNVTYVASDFLKWQPDRKYDVLLCLQVLEHLENREVESFTRKLLNTAKHVVISVPYMWPAGHCRYHKQDPVDERKLQSWTGIAPTKSQVSECGRLVCNYRQAG